MNCDQVFQVLTRGPFPSGAAEDVLVDDHLDRCTSCWRIAEALRPAHDLFQESLSPAECRTLPGYWGDTMPPRAYLEEITEERQQTLGVKPQGARAAGTVVQPTASLAPVFREQPEAMAQGPWANSSPWLCAAGAILLLGVAALGCGVALGLGWLVG